MHQEPANQNANETAYNSRAQDTIDAVVASPTPALGASQKADSCNKTHYVSPDLRLLGINSDLLTSLSTNESGLHLAGTYGVGN